MRLPVAARAVAATLTGSLLAFLGLALGQQVHRNGFEARNPAWVKGPADAPFKEMAHDVTEQTAHSGQFSEHLQLTAEVGSFIHYLYPTGRAPIADELIVKLWIKANRPGTQLLARLVLPRERNPQNLDEPLTTLIRGDTYQMAGRWQRLELRRPVKLAREQQQLMRAELKRDVDFTDAFIDQLVLNVYGGPGLTEVWIDDLELGPILEATPFQPTSRPADVPGGMPPATRPEAEARPRVPVRGMIVELSQDHLLVGGKRFFFRGIRHSNTPLKTLRDAGFNTVWFDADTPPQLLDEAVNLGFWLVPALGVAHKAPQLVSHDHLSRQVARFGEGDAVLFWDLGGGLAVEQAPLIDQAARIVHATDAQRPVAADVWDGFRRYSRCLDLLGVHRWPLMTSLELPQYREWLDQRRRMARPGTFTWTWVQTHLPDWYTALVYGQAANDRFTEPIGPQPEQIRLLTYLALAAGCRGLGYWSDRFLADSHHGRDRLLQLALLNQEMQMLEPLLTSVTEPPLWIETSQPEVQAAVFRSERGILVLPIWLGKGAQFVPGQSAGIKLAMIVPLVPTGVQAWEITPAEVRSLQSERVMGGTKVIVPEFGLTTAIVFTGDISPTGLLVRFQDHVRRVRKLAAQWAHDLAETEIAKVMKVEEELEQAGHTLPDGQQLADNARARLKACEEHWTNGDYRQAYQEAQRALRPVRILMRAQWEQAIRGLDSAVASPYAVSFFTLPRHWRFLEELRETTAGENVLPDGDFEVQPNRSATAWTAQEIALDEVELTARRVTGREGNELVPSQERPPRVGQTVSRRSDRPREAIPTRGRSQDGRAVEPDDEREGKLAREGEQCLMLKIKRRGVPDPPPPTTPTPAQTVSNPRTPQGLQGPMNQWQPGMPGQPLSNQNQPWTPGIGSMTPATPEAPARVVPSTPGLERTFLAIHSPAVRLPPGSLVRVSAWVQVPYPITSSVDGALFYDSVGGEPLAIRLTEPTGWKKIALYRRVPASGQISVTLALTGVGTVYFDDVRIEPLTVTHAPSRRPHVPVAGQN